MIQDDKLLDNLAREILMVDEEGKSLIPEYESIIERGFANPLPSDVDRRDVLIIGAGIAGLVTGKILKKNLRKKYWDAQPGVSTEFAPRK